LVTAASQQRRQKAAEAEAEGSKEGENASSRLSLWANIRDRMFGGGTSKASDHVTLPKVKLTCTTGARAQLDNS